LLHRFDLRYVPDSQDFSAREPREEADCVPAGYQPPEVGIAAMLHTKPRLMWDADDDDRKRMLSRKVTKDELRDDDFKVPTPPSPLWVVCRTYDLCKCFCLILKAGGLF